MEAAIEELRTIRDWLRWAVSHFTDAGLFFGHGCDNAYDEAVWLILATLHLPNDRLEAFLDARLTRSERIEVHNVLQQRIARRIPAAYLTHEAWLGEFRFYVDERVIVPRSCFAELLEEHLVPWVEDPARIDTALDLCTGSACLAVLMAHAFPVARVDAVDLSDDALAVARRNVQAYGLDDRIALRKSDLFDALDGRRYDLILSNPPYVTSAAMAEIPAEYRHEPVMALEAGKQGLDIVSRIIAESAAHLTNRGVLMVEVGHNGHVVEAAYPNLPFTWVDTPSGNAQIFMLTREQLLENQPR